VFVLAHADDLSLVCGYYTLTAALIQRASVSTQHQKKVPPGIPVPLIRIGYMGRDDSTAPNLGAALVVDAARRVYRNLDIAAWGLVLDAEGQNEKLMARYVALGADSDLSAHAFQREAAH
jgi:hypothetical protein